MGRTKFIANVLVVIALAVSVVGGFFYWKAQRDAERVADAMTRIADRDVEFSNMELGAVSSGVAKLRGNVRNNSPSTLKSFKLWVHVLDCPDDECELIGDSTATVTNINVPWEQDRNFEADVSLPNMSIPAEQKLGHGILELEADLR